MKKNKKTFLLSCLLALAFSSHALGEKSQEHDFDIPVPSYLVINADTGEVLRAKNPRAPHAPASLVKMMTLYLSMEAIKKGKVRWDETYRVPKWVSLMGGSEAKMWHGEKITVRDLFKAAAVGSANDAAAALAEIVGGSQEAFVAAMNRKTAELGLSRTYFRSPHGLPARNGDRKDTTTANDLAKLALAILRHHPEILQFTGLKETYIRRGKYRFFNTNKLIGKFSGMNGLKTGYTDEAGFCLVAMAKQGNLCLISVVLGAQSNKERFDYTARLLKDSFARFTNVELPCKGKSFEIYIPKSQKPFDMGITSENLFFTAPKTRVHEIAYELFIPNQVEAPIAKGERIALYVATLDGQTLARAKVIAKEDVKKAGFLRRLLSSH